MISTKKAIQYFKIAEFQANTLSKDPSSKVGCIFLKPKTYEQLTMGYNGMPRKINESLDTGRWNRPQKYMWVEHAERNAIYNACRNGIPLENSIVITTKFPCCDCTRGIIQSGAIMIITSKPNMNDKNWKESSEVALEMIKEYGISLHYIEDLIKHDDNSNWMIF